MKTGILLLLAMLSLNTVSADNIKKSTSEIGVTNRYYDAVTFVERGIQFHVFLNGDFDFNTHYNRYTDYGIRIKRDRNGRIRSVGNVFINYDARGNVKRIGSVFMRYKYGNLFKVGNLHIRYDRWGNPQYTGFVKPNHNHYYDNHYYNDGLDVNIDVNIGGVFDYDDAYFYRRDFTRNYRKFKEDNDFFYYRALPNAKKGKKNKVIKRRKNKNYKKNYYKKGTLEQKGKSRRNN